MSGNVSDSFAAPLMGARVPELADPDACFSMLTDACRDLDDAQGHLFHAQLVLVLMHHIADPDVLRDAIAIARAGID
ncbi:DUF2783 domain-containing protein [Burkholderia oklahomensis]|uniref:DUF2783 domain-containing protein n=1 Tax=Burkholderia oklahomensis TaxID=342113 RepID=A0AAI8FM18_9BURK|nr:DUF2783 domain-containing protein [Burkholderia oklahomensis]AIO65340.1 hypothetical protein DM82_1353 [Burkholderia oklahomensis]AJX32254.1 hypothetical protein BG90_3341 [Burkholderia oklahomensis C6786]AOI42381.1 hypothetical protein WG70_22590 [Burkholderia oklahomensis EO147]AOI45946.1 hypothetical protein WI23_09215 [Burkholderia oklahomensis C6786]KUY52693.1 hypothetical protein WG70_00325 [Burkholderia oklahomensis EO147]